MLQYPVRVPPCRLTDGFGGRESFNAGGFKTGRMHGGRDIAPPLKGQTGVILHAVGASRVVATRINGADRNEWGNKAIYNAAAGNFIITEHVAYQNVPFLNAWGVAHTRIWVGQSHLASVRASVGDWLNTGDELAVMGRTGAATGEHVHIDVFTDRPSLGGFAFDRRVDPDLVMRPWPADTKTVDVPAKADTPAAQPAPTPAPAPEPAPTITIPEDTMPMLIRIQGKDYFTNGRGYVLVKNENDRLQLDAALKSWAHARSQGEHSFGLGRYNGAKLLTYLDALAK